MTGQTSRLLLPPLAPGNYIYALPRANATNSNQEAKLTLPSLRRSTLSSRDISGDALRRRDPLLRRRRRRARARQGAHDHLLAQVLHRRAHRLADDGVGRRRRQDDEGARGEREAAAGGAAAAGAGAPGVQEELRRPGEEGAAAGDVDEGGEGEAAEAGHPGCAGGGGGARRRGPVRREGDGRGDGDGGEGGGLLLGEQERGQACNGGWTWGDHSSQDSRRLPIGKFV